MRAVSKKKKTPENVIALNRKARFEFHIEETMEAGLALEGWEVKSLRAGRVNLQEAYVLIRRGEAWLIGCTITPLPTASTHIKPDPTRTRRLLLHKKEIARLTGAADREGYTVVPLDLHWKRGKAKLSIGLAKGKKKHDKRADQKEQDWQRQKQRLMKHKV
ncbi:SsrA-binding protein [Alkalilimnicola ehrlichii MLHE-1]|uniref:SsrA-binding protein n=1 Tax=Alkalilimnicola ehrlichii (strain ATCC BAA-1101 / DSM 17681 / MLHE-1) TaxID=187272 RepID=SSRP_ALKEH|nr:RecName: Full=SsrA-binding protein; AltName: Full=Small protein B [Alkalilimnicola ehrlichii MLHE-1]ABI57253.1 SsrA-binding protein [Alkalilimnicola ehrlichii MLHE-1]